MEPDYSLIPEAELKEITNKDSVNINVGVLGHVDSGKTSICRVLSQVTSTASMDKNPQSQQRGITLDLGFSAFFTRMPQHLQEQCPNKKYLQFTLVDCPGHASLIKTVIGGAQIIDLMFLIVDINKVLMGETQGIQTQTAECISIGELLIDKLIVVLNKVDMLGEGSEELLKKKMEALRKVFGKTRYGEKVTMVPFSTKLEGRAGEFTQLLKNTLLNSITIPKRNDKGNLLMLVDHCFPIKGKGSVVTGTVVEGAVKPGDEVEFPLIQERKKVKSMQMFRKPVNSAGQGDRVALLFTQLESDLIERGLCCSPGYVTLSQNCIIKLNKIRYFKLPLKNKSKFHVISGHQTVMAQLRIFYTLDKLEEGPFDFNRQYETGESYEAIEQTAASKGMVPTIFCLLAFEKDMYANPGSLLVGYKFDGDINDNVCRLAFYGNMLVSLRHDQIAQPNMLKIYRYKSKGGQIEKLVDRNTVLVKDLFMKEVNINNFVGKEVCLELTGNIGRVHSAFGKNGKVKVQFDQPVLEYNVRSQQPPTEELLVGSSVTMNYKKYYTSKK